MRKVSCFNNPVGDIDLLNNWYISSYQVGEHSYFATEDENNQSIDVWNGQNLLDFALM